MEKDLKEKDLKEKDLKEKDLKEKDRKEKDRKGKDLKGKDLKGKDLKEKEEIPLAKERDLLVDLTMSLVVVLQILVLLNTEFVLLQQHSNQVWNWPYEKNSKQVIFLL